MKVIKIKKDWFSQSDVRLDASYHLSDGPKTKRKLKRSPYPLSILGEETIKLYSGSIFKRTFVENEKYGYPYITASDMMKSDINSGKFISKKYTEKATQLMIKKDWILLSCSGTLGNVVYTNDDFEGKIGTHDLIRIIPNNKNVLGGYLYAYLASKYGYALLTQSSYGGVVKHIEPHHIKELSVPIMPDEKQKEIHDLIIKATALRVEANILLRNAINLIEENLPEYKAPKIYISNINSRKDNNFRLEAGYNTRSIDSFYTELQTAKIECKSIEDLSMEVYTPGIFKRVRTNNIEKGIPFLSGSDLLDQIPKFNNYLSKKMKNIDNYILKEGWLAIQDAGTIGYLSFVTKFIDGVAATNNLIRVKPYEHDNSNFYIYCFLKSKQGQQILKSYEFGSVQKHIDNHQISKLQVPILTMVYKNISEDTSKAMQIFSKSCFLENQAIDLIEKEIESWQE